MVESLPAPLLIYLPCGSPTPDLKERKNNMEFMFCSCYLDSIEGEELEML